MAFSTLVKKELTHLKCKNRCCRLAELIALVRTDGTLHIQKGNYALHVSSENAAVARKTLKLFFDLFNLRSEVSVRKTTPQKANNYVIFFEPQKELDYALKKLGIFKISKGMHYNLPQRLVKKKCCAVAFLRGAFLGGGFVSDPQKTSHHFEIVVNNEEMALSLVSLLFQFNLKARVNPRYQDSAGKESFAVYLKSSDQIVQLLALMGAYEALFKWENARIIKGLRVEVNRLVNCDTANLNKLVKAALSQMMDITLIEEEVGLSNLSKGLKEIARARTKYPQVSIKELGEVFEPPLSKSAVYHRIRRLGKLAEDLRKKAG